MHTLITDPYSTDLSLFVSLLNEQNIQHTYVYCDGDEYTSFYDTVVFTFKSKEDCEIATNIHDKYC